MKIKIKKRNYLLIEILLSMALVSICLFPLIQPLFLQLKKEKEVVHNLQFEMMAKNSFLEFKQEIYDRNKNITVNFEKGLSGSLPSLKIPGGKDDIFVEREYLLNILQSYDKRSLKSTYYLAEVEIKLTVDRKTKSYFYTAFIQEQFSAL